MFRVDLKDPALPCNFISLMDCEVPGCCMLEIGEKDNKVVCRMMFSEDAMRSLSRAALVIADQVHVHASKSRPGDHS
jgi:hypothetical protein